MKVLAVYANKGGVGKTSAAVNLAWSAAHDGLRTLLWDLDPQGSASYLFRVKPKVKGGAQGIISGDRELGGLIKASDFANLDLLPSDFSYRHMDMELDATKKPTRRIGKLLSSLQDEYDLVVIDCPPTISMASESVLEAADVVAVPIVPSTLSARTADQLDGFVRDFEGNPPRLFGFISIVDRRRALHQATVEALPQAHAWIRPLCIPSSSVVEQMAVRRAPLHAFAQSTPAAQAYAELWIGVRSALFDA